MIPINGELGCEGGVKEKEEEVEEVSLRTDADLTIARMITG